MEAAAREANYDFSGVMPPQNDKDHYSLCYAEFVVPLVKAVQDQRKMIEQLQNRIEELEKRAGGIADLKDMFKERQLAIESLINV